MSEGYRFSVCCLQVADLEDLAGFYLAQGEEGKAEAVQAVMTMGHAQVDDQAIERQRAYHAGQDSDRLAVEQAEALLLGLVSEADHD